MIYKIIIFLILIALKTFSIETYPKELDLKDIPIVDLFAHLSKYSKYTIIGDSYVKDISVDGYFKMGSSIDDILKTVELTYGLTRVKNGNTLIFRNRKSENSFIVPERIA